MIDIVIENVTRSDGTLLAINITSIFQDEPTTGQGQGDKFPDGEGVGTPSPKVRAERNDSANGRVYHISFEASDGAEQSCSGDVIVSIPASNNGPPAVDDGSIYDSTIES